MKRIKRWVKEIFEPEVFQDLDVAAIVEALTDLETRTVWLHGILEELKHLNVEVDKRLLSGSDLALTDLCARRKALQFVLESVLTAKRNKVQKARHNPPVGIDLDRVTA